MLAISRGTHKTRHASNANDFQKISIAGTEHPAPSHKVGGQIKLVYYGTAFILIMMRTLQTLLARAIQESNG